MLKISGKNAKLGKDTQGHYIKSWCQSVEYSCVFKSKWCGANCYTNKAIKIYPQVYPAWDHNYKESFKDSFVTDFVKFFKRYKAASFRIHAAGDFHSIFYVLKWKEIIEKVHKFKPDLKFWFYSRAWVSGSMLDPDKYVVNVDMYQTLSTLVQMDNVQGFLSLDPSMGNVKLPENYRTIGWRLAYAYDKPDQKPKGLNCPAISKKLKSCGDCGFCFREVSGTGTVCFSKH